MSARLHSASRRRLARGPAAASILLLALGAARAEDSPPLSSRVMEWFRGGSAGKEASPPPPKTEAPSSAPKTGETSPEPVPEGTPIPGTNVQIVNGGSTQNRVMNMLGLGKGEGEASADVARKKAAASGITECPDIVVEGAGAEMRSPAGADASSVAYQISVTRMARECVLAEDNVSMRVGLLGAAMLGPAGKPGGYFGSLRVALRRKSDNQLFGAKTYRVGATIPANQSRADFTLLVEDLAAPFVHANAAEDYEVVVGFTQGGGNAGEGDAKPRRKKRGGE